MKTEVAGWHVTHEWRIAEGNKVWVALVCTFFDHNMQVATEVQLRW